MSSADRIRIVSQSRDLKILPFRDAEQKHSRGIHWTEWLEDIERQFRYFKIHDPFDQRDALIIYGGREIARLEKALPDLCGKLNEYEKLKMKLNTYFLPQRNKYYARYLFLKMTPRAGETTISFATRLRENAFECEFGDNLEERILEHLIFTSQNDHLVQKCIKECWTLSEFLTEARLSEDVALQAQKINESSGKYNIAKVKKRSKRKRNTDTVEHLQPCRYCGLSGLHPKGRQCPAYGKRCFQCHKIDHFAAVCRTKQYTETLLHKPPSSDSFLEPKKKRVKKTMKVGYFNKDYIDKEYRFNSSRDGYTRIKNVNKLEENDEPLWNLNLANVENADTAKTMVEGWQTPASTKVSPRSVNLDVDKKRRSAKEHTSLRDNVNNYRMEYCRNQIAYMRGEMERMKLELKNMQNKCCLIMKSRGELDIQQIEKTDEAKGFHNITPRINY